MPPAQDPIPAAFRGDTLKLIANYVPTFIQRFPQKKTSYLCALTVFLRPFSAIFRFSGGVRPLLFKNEYPSAKVLNGSRFRLFVERQKEGPFSVKINRENFTSFPFYSFLNML